MNKALHNRILPILSISGSDSTGGAGIQGDIKTIAALGGYAVTVITQVTVQSLHAVLSCHNLPVSVVKQQLEAILLDVHPSAIKIGMTGSCELVSTIADAIRGESHVVYAPVVEASHGARLMTAEVVAAACRRLLPLADLLILKASDLSHFLSGVGGSAIEVVSVTEAIRAAKVLASAGVNNVLIYGCRTTEGVSASVLLLANGEVRHFTMSATDNLKTHGLGSTLSSAVATFIGSGKNVEDAVAAAHEYVRSLVLYSVKLHSGRDAQLIRRGEPSRLTDRSVEIYNNLMQLIAQHHKRQHDVAFYSESLCVSARYLAQVTHRVAGKSPKQVLEDYIFQEVEREVVCTPTPLLALSIEFGFKSQAQFSKFFKKKKGAAPSELR